MGNATEQLLQAKAAAAEELDDWLAENGDQPENVRFAVSKYRLQLLDEVAWLERKITERKEGGIACLTTPWPGCR